MKDFTDKIADVEKEIAKEKGPFSLFALFLRDDVPDRWDLVVSAPWVKNNKQTLNYLVHEIKSTLTPDDLISLSRIVMVEPSDKPVQAINRAFNVEHGKVEVRDVQFFGLPIKHGYIITSRRAA
jgi:hypothetical protein